jgi:HEPN domain-containing protein
LVKAHRDLRPARALAALDEPATDTAVNQCPQAAEKALKGCLPFRDRPWERTRDLERLPELASALEPAFVPLETQADALNSYATAFHYPDTLGVHLPSVAEVEAAIEHAQDICDFVLGQLPTEVQPA